MGRAPCCDKAKVKKGPWSPEEDAKLKSHIQKHGTGGNWIALPAKIGLKRCGKSCRLRWLNYLRPNLKHGGFTQDEDNLICSLYVSIGSRWSIMAAQLPGRTDNDIKNYWNTRLKKKLFGKQRRSEHHARRAAEQPPPPPPSVADHAPDYMPQMEANFCFFNNFEGMNHYYEWEDSSAMIDSSMIDLPSQVGIYDAMPQLHAAAAAAAITSSSSMENVMSWEDLSCVSYQHKYVSSTLGSF